MLDAYQQGHDAGARLGVVATVLGHYAGDPVKAL
jgi:hypothetical protein